MATGIRRRFRMRGLAPYGVMLVTILVVVVLVQVVGHETGNLFADVGPGLAV